MRPFVVYGVILASIALLCLLRGLGSGLLCSITVASPNIRTPRRQLLTSAVGLSSGLLAHDHGGSLARASTDGKEYDAIASAEVVSIDGTPRKLGDLIDGEKQTIVALLTHFGDFNSWEYTQQLKFELPNIEQSGASLVVVGIGGAPQAKKFAELLELPSGVQLFADPKGAAAIALGCSRGFGGGTPLSGYVKLLPMLLGIGSPGTLEAVFRGYRGDASARRDWVDASLAQGSTQRRFPEGLTSTAWDSLGTSGLRPMELATLRLQNMVDGIIAHWSELTPSDDQLLVQQGGTVIFRARKPTYVYRDAGILTYTPIDDVLGALKAV